MIVYRSKIHLWKATHGSRNVYSISWSIPGAVPDRMHVTVWFSCLYGGTSASNAPKVLCSSANTSQFPCTSQFEVSVNVPPISNSCSHLHEHYGLVHTTPTRLLPTERHFSSRICFGEVDCPDSKWFCTQGCPHLNVSSPSA